LETRPAGRIGDRPSQELGQSIDDIGFRMGRLKTGKSSSIQKAKKKIKFLQFSVALKARLHD